MATVEFEGAEFTVRADYVPLLEAIFARAALSGGAGEEEGVPHAPDVPAVPEDAFDGVALSDTRARGLGRFVVGLADTLSDTGRRLCAQGQPWAHQHGQIDWPDVRRQLRGVLAQVPQLRGVVREEE